MNNRNRTSPQKKKKRRPANILKPADGVREYYGTASVLSAFFGTLPVSVASIIMAKTEARASGNVQAILSAVGICLLCVGLLVTYVLSRLGRLFAVHAAGSGMLSAVGAGLLAESEISRLLMEPDVIGALQIITMTVFLVCLCIMFAALFIGSLGMRVRPVLGVPLCAAFILSALMYVFRAATAFSSLLTALGKNYNWDNTGDLVSVKRWILRSVEQGTEDSKEMLTIAMIYAVAVILAFLLSVSAVFSFKAHFEDFNTRLLISLDTHRYTGHADISDEERDEFEEDIEDDYYDGMETLERTRYEAERYDEMRTYREESERVHREAAYRTAKMGGYDFDDGIYDFTDDSSSAGGNGYGNEASGSGEDVVRTPSGSVRVKVRRVSAADEKPAIPDPDDESIWNRYLD